MARRGKVEHKVTPEEVIVRPVRSRKYNEYFLIVCEDERTEPYYFAKYQRRFDELFNNKRTVYLKTVGTGKNSLGVVEEAILERDRLQAEADTHIDHVWAVFDKDDLDESAGNLQRFKDAFVLAEKEGIMVAYSNECFELWLLLHFIDISPDVPLKRKENIYPSLNECVNKGRTEKTKITYDHQHPSPAFIDAVEAGGSQEKAIERSAALDKHHKALGHDPVESNPITKVYKLVTTLNGLYEWYNYDDEQINNI